MNLFFITTAAFFSYNTKESFNFIAIDILFTILVVWTAIYAIRNLINRNKKGFKAFAVMRMIIELVKIAKAVLILMSINGAFRISPEMKETLGDIKFSILVQEILSLVIFIPILPLGHYIFSTFAQSKYS